MSATTSSDSRLRHPQRHAAPFVVVTDRLPGSRPGQEATLGITGLPDDPVTAALAAVANRGRGAWVGRPQDFPPRPWQALLRELALDSDDVQQYDAGQAQQTIWPLYHSMVRPAAHSQRWWAAYRRVNRAFAAAASDAAAPGGTVWVHDYHLQLVPGLLRQARPDLLIGFSLHTPFPPADLFEHMPMHRELLLGLLGADLLGFQTTRAAENFLRISEDLSRTPPIELDSVMQVPEVGVYPTSVDTPAIVELTTRTDIARRALKLRRDLGDTRIVLSIDAADESHAIQRRLRAIADMFRSGQLAPEEFTLIQIVTDSPSGTPLSGSDLAGEIAREAARINGRFASVGRPCLHYVFTEPNLEERVVLYRVADVMMATPLREGASTRALEYIAAAPPGGALVLSEFTGTAAMLPEAFLANPYDNDQIHHALLAALASKPDDRRRRMAAMREYVTNYDTYAWARTFLTALHSHETQHHDGDVRQHEPSWPGYNLQFHTDAIKWMRGTPTQDLP